MLHLISKITQANLAFAFKLIVAEGVFVHHSDSQRFSSVHDVESETLVPDGSQSTLLVVGLNFLVFDFEDHIRVGSSIHIHRLQVSCLNNVHCEDGTEHDTIIVKLLRSLIVI